MKLSVVFFLLVALCLGSPSAWAHPHAWIDYKVDVLMDGRGHVTGLREYWLFDPFYTEFALRDFASEDKNAGKPPKDKRQILMDLAEDNLKNLEPFHYFTELTLEKGKPLPFQKFEAVTSRLEKDQIAMDFTLKLKTPIAIEGHKIHYRIYDPSYYIAMRHMKKKDPVVFKETGSLACHADIVTPKPDLAHLNLASSLDQKAVAPPDLGGYFAQRVTLTCL